MQKVFACVTVKYNEAGQAWPLSIEWEDGRVFEMGRVLDVRRAASLKVGRRACATPAAFGAGDLSL